MDQSFALERFLISFKFNSRLLLSRYSCHCIVNIIELFWATDYMTSYNAWLIFFTSVVSDNRISAVWNFFLLLGDAFVNDALRRVERNHWSNFESQMNMAASPQQVAFITLEWAVYQVVQLREFGESDFEHLHKLTVMVWSFNVSFCSLYPHVSCFTFHFLSMSVSLPFFLYPPTFHKLII